jgi:hypothetical protein
MSIPLIQEATKDAINTSIIAIKRNIERINMLLGLVDSGSPDLSGLATKQELQDAVESLQPVDEVTIDNMQSVSSNAVAKAFNGGEWETVENSIQCKRIGNIVFIYVNDSIYFSSTGSDAKSYSTNNTIVLPEKYRPTKEINVFMAWNNNDVLFRLRVYSTGKLRSWNLGSIMTLPTGSSNHQWESFICYCVN